MRKNDSLNVFEYQTLFLRGLTELTQNIVHAQELGERIKPEWRYRLKTYQASFLGRVTASLSATVFQPCEDLFGREFVIHILASFFQEHPPRSPMLTSAADDLPIFLRRQELGREAQLFSDLAEVCILRWQVLTSADDTEDAPAADVPLATVRLRAHVRFVWPSAHHNLAVAWEHPQMHAENQKDPISREHATWDETIFSQKCGVLLGRSSATAFHVVEVPAPLEVFVRSLMNGSSIESAVHDLEEHLQRCADISNPEQIPALLQTLLHKLSALQLLGRVSSTADPLTLSLR